MKSKSIALIVMLFAGTSIAFACMFNHIELVPSLLYVAATLLIFYIIGLIINGIITKINTEAEKRAKMLAKMKKEAEEKAKLEAQKAEEVEEAEEADAGEEPEEENVEKVGPEEN